MSPSSDNHVGPGDVVVGAVNAESPVKVVILCAVSLFCQAIGAFLSAVDGLEVVGLAQELNDVLDQIVVASADVVLVDVACPGALDLVCTLANRAPACKIVGLGLSEAEHNVVAWAEAGAMGYISPHESLDDAIGTIRAVTKGEALFSAHATARLLSRMRELAKNETLEREHADLTAREIEVLQLMNQGLSNKEIGDRLSIEVATVKTHVHSILTKLHLARRSQVGAWLRHRTLTNPMLTDILAPASAGSHARSTSLA
jgi:two-component system, NarL family, nitrate/nitrite response regulator NarL